LVAVCNSDIELLITTCGASLEAWLIATFVLRLFRKKLYKLILFSHGDKQLRILWRRLMSLEVNCTKSQGRSNHHGNYEAISNSSHEPPLFNDWRNL
jgi:hypothetical protein